MEEVALISDGAVRPFQMPQILDKKVGEWRELDRKARELEKVLARLPVRGEGPPSTDLIREAKMLRKLANEKLKAAIAAIKPNA
jgi:hypothetical protein